MIWTPKEQAAESQVLAEAQLGECLAQSRHREAAQLRKLINQRKKP